MAKNLFEKLGNVFYDIHRVVYDIGVIFTILLKVFLVFLWNLPWLIGM